MNEVTRTTLSTPNHTRAPTLADVVVRFAGDSGDGMQLTGAEFTEATATAGNDFATLPDIPAEIRAPAGSIAGVSAFQIDFGSDNITTAGDAVDVLVAMNPAALKANLATLYEGGLLIVDSGTFTDRYLRRAGFQTNPLDDGSLDAYRVIAVDVSRHIQELLKPFGFTHRSALRSRNMWVLGLVAWLFERELEPMEEALQEKFGNKGDIVKANLAALKAGHAYAETVELPEGVQTWKVPPAKLEPGLYRRVTGTEALAWGLLMAGRLADLPIVFASYPITPASALLHALADRKEFDVTTFQAEDEIAAVCSAVGASFAGALGITSSSGPGISLKQEGISLAISAELPLVIVDHQRAGPSTGLPTKTEQSDLEMALFGRHGDTHIPLIAPAFPGDCFDVAIEAVRLAVRYMTPVMILSDGYLANVATPWRIPALSGYERIESPVARPGSKSYQPFARNAETLARAWAIPGTPGLEHRLGGLEKEDVTGYVSYDPDNHQRMTDLRTHKIDRIVRDLPEQEVAQGEDHGRLAVVGWGSTYGAIHQAVRRARAEGLDVSHIHVRHLWPLPGNLGELLGRFDRVLVPELNKGQFLRLLRAEFVLDARGLQKVNGQPFRIDELEHAIRERLR
jgi:2-oxoglutarate ferredoxin oxidoreductase subunit alpha